MKEQIKKYVLDPMLLTSILVSLIGLLWIREKQYIMAVLLFLSGISSYIYHYDNTDRFLYYDIFFSVTSFIYSVYLARRLSVKGLYEISTIVIVAFFYYILNILYHEYYFHLMWHIMILIGQIYLFNNVML